MTQLRHCKCGISNYFDKLLDGIGHRGSSFMDFDGVTHDRRTSRFLVQEFKNQGEKLNKAQRETLAAAAEHGSKSWTVWVVIRRRDGIGVIDWATKRGRVFSETEYQDLYRAWWNDPGRLPSFFAKPAAQATPDRFAKVEPLLDTEICW